MLSIRFCCACALSALLVLAAGCGSSGTDPAGAAAGKASGWTTLGTRKTAATPARTVASAAGAQWSDYDPPTRYPQTLTSNNQFINMDDGIRLAASVTHPADAAGVAIPGALPVVLTLTGYNKDVGAYVPTLGGANPHFVTHGYVHVNVDVRGTGRSDGQWAAFDAREQQDYSQVVDWVVAQPWCNGNIGMYGASFLGITSLLTASQRHPAIKAAFPIVPMSDSYRDVVLVGGQGSYAFLTGWLGFVTLLSVFDPSLYDDPAQAAQAMIAHVTSAATNFQVPTLLRGLIGDPEIVYDSDFWALRSPVERMADVNVPVFIVGGLHDIFQRGEPRLYESLKNHVTAKLLMGPWTHFDAATGAGLPADGVPVLDHIALMWFDRYLRGIDNGAERLPNVTQYVWGQGHYQSSSDWPHPGARAQRMYLHSEGALSTAPPGATGAARRIVQEPFNGICSESAVQVSLGLLGLVPLPCFEDDRIAQLLELSYDTPPLTEDLYFNGPIQADLWVSTTAADTPLVVRVSDVGPDGKAFPLTSGIQTASLRAVDPARSRYLDGQMIQPWHPFTAESIQAVGSGNIVEVALEVFPTNALIAKGHVLRVSVGASNFPFGLPPLPSLPQTGLGLLSIYSDAEHPSSMVFPVVK